MSLQTDAAAGSIPPHAATVDAVLLALNCDAVAGLPAHEVQERLLRYGPNALRQRAPANVLKILVSQFASPVVYLLTGAALIALMMGEIGEALAVVIVLVINAAIGFFTEMQAVRSMEALRSMTSPTVLVRRNGAAVTVPAETLVPGDIVILDAGDIVAADMRLVSAANLAADESALTGESLPVEKSLEPVAADAIVAERPPMLFKGSAITRGTGEAVVTQTGMATELGRITRLVEEASSDRSPLEKQLARLSRDLIWVTLVITAFVGVAGIVMGHELGLMLESAIALAVAAIPEGLPIVATLALARGMLRMARRNALVERLSAVETLGAATVILTDKTGTLTENRMHVERIVSAEGEFVLDRAHAMFIHDGAAQAPAPGSGLMLALQAIALCNNAELGANGGEATGDPMEVALLEAAAAGGFSRPVLLAEHPELIEHAFDVQHRMMATVHRDGARHLVAVKGAPEAVLAHVAAVRSFGGMKPFSDDMHQHWMSVCDGLAAHGLRLLAVAGKDMPEAGGEPYEALTLYGVVGLHDPPRQGVAQAIKAARRAGLSVVMVTGDHAATAGHVAEAVGLATAADTVIEGRSLKALAEMTQAERDALRHVRIFSRVDPAQKLDLIKLHQEAGEIVAMTGDGVNDAPALKQADIGIAMGLRGTQVAREAAALVLRDDAFETIIEAVREGRMIYTNIRRFVAYLLSCNLSEILVVGLAVIAGLPLPLLPLQILFLNLVTDVFPAFALGTIAADGNVMRRKPRPPKEPILARPQWIGIAIHGPVIAAATLGTLAVGHYWLGIAGAALTTMCFHTLALAQLWHVFNMRNWRETLLSSAVPRNAYVWLALGLSLALLAAANLVPHIAAALQLVPLTRDAWATVLAFSLLPNVVNETIALLRRLRHPARRH
jgi:Ca2+-transporting ATPase